VALMDAFFLLANNLNKILWGAFDKSFKEIMGNKSNKGN